MYPKTSKRPSSNSMNTGWVRLSSVRLSSSAAPAAPLVLSRRVVDVQVARRVDGRAERRVDALAQLVVELVLVLAEEAGCHRAL